VSPPFIYKGEFKMRLLVSGDRNWEWENRHIILQEIKDLSPAIIIHGGARGVDYIAGKVGDFLNIETIVYPAEWDTYGKAAGPIRNLQMIKEGKPDFILGFHTDIENSKGTKHMINQAIRYKIPYKLITETKLCGKSLL
jgi:hypothetical protein